MKITMLQEPCSADELASRREQLRRQAACATQALKELNQRSVRGAAAFLLLYLATVLTWLATGRLTIGSTLLCWLGGVATGATALSLGLEIAAGGAIATALLLSCGTAYCEDLAGSAAVPAALAAALTAGWLGVYAGRRSAALHAAIEEGASQINLLTPIKPLVHGYDLSSWCASSPEVADYLVKVSAQGRLATLQEYRLLQAWMIRQRKDGKVAAEAGVRREDFMQLAALGNLPGPHDDEPATQRSDQAT